MCATWVPQIIGAVPEIQHGESRVTTEGVYSPNVAMSIHFRSFSTALCSKWHETYSCSFCCTNERELTKNIKIIPVFSNNTSITPHGDLYNHYYPVHIKARLDTLIVWLAVGMIYHILFENESGKSTKQRQELLISHQLSSHHSPDYY